ncbi:SulP family inorganic anion transporter [Hydrogenophaga sp.]|uniref:SulP family inorganic anion transporter n=1 Tax=Hydrogenophaga sp. TaxID=1904254 RepID=UPI003564D04A
MIRWQRFFPFLAWPRLSGSLLRGEAMAGLTVGLMVIPQGVAYATLAGLPPITGIYAAMLPTLVGVLFSASTRLAVGPTALSCLLVSTSLTGLAEPGSAQWVELAVWLALLAGLLQIVLGLVRFGWLLNLVNAPVLMAFTQAAALLIIGSQLPGLLGLQGDWSGALSAAGWHLPSLAFGLGSLLALMLARRWRPGFPSVLLVVLATSGISYGIGFEALGGRVIGPLPHQLPSLALPGWPGWAVLSQLLLPTLIITLVSFLETAASAKVDNGQQDQLWNQNQDLLGQGLAKIASALSGSFPTSTSFSRSALNLYAGARSGWATVFSVVVVTLCLLVFTPLLQHVPRAVLAAIVLVAVLSLVKPGAFVRLWRISRTEALIAVSTFAITLLASPQLHWGVIAGVIMALSHFLYQRLHPRIIEVGLHADGSLRDRHLWHLPPLRPHMYAMRMDAALDFATASALERAITERLATQPDTHHVVIFAQAFNWIDASGVEMMGILCPRLREKGVTLHLVGLKLPIETVLRKAGALEDGPGLRLYRTDAEALHAFAKKHMGDTIVDQGDSLVGPVGS